jgi:hypothetical protein
MCYDDLGELDSALEDYNNALAHDPNYTEVYNNRGEVYRRKGDFGNAMKDFEKALSLEPGFAEPHFNIGLVLEAQGKKQDAAKKYLLFLKAVPDVPDKALILARIQKIMREAGEKAAPPPKPAPQKSEAAAPPPQPEKPGPPTKTEPARKPAEGAPPRPAAPAQPLPPAPSSDPAARLLTAFEKAAGAGAAQAAKQLGEQASEYKLIIAGICVLVYLFGSAMYFLIGSKTGSGAPWQGFVPVATGAMALSIGGGSSILRLVVMYLSYLALPVGVAAAMIGLDFFPMGGVWYAAAALSGVLVLLMLGLLVGGPLFWTQTLIQVAAARGKALVFGLLAALIEWTPALFLILFAVMATLGPASGIIMLVCAAIHGVVLIAHIVGMAYMGLTS